MTRDIALLLIGAGIALISSIITAFLQHWLLLRVERTKKKMERIERESQELRSKITEGSQFHLTSVSKKVLESKDGHWFPKVIPRASNTDANMACFLTGKPISSCDCVNCQKARMQSTNIRKSSEKIEVGFTHPRNAKIFTTKVSPHCTGQAALDGLLLGNDEGSFLDPTSAEKPYEMVILRSSQIITASMTFEQAGVLAGDVIEVRQNAPGAGPDWSELGQMLFWSAAAASVFLKAAVPVLIEFLKSKASRSVIVQKGQDKRIYTGYDADEIRDIQRMLDTTSTSNKQSGNVDKTKGQMESPISVTILDFDRKDSAES